MTDEADFQRCLDAEPENWCLRRVFADWLEECGECERAAGQKWQSEKRRHPVYSEWSKDWRWYGSTSREKSWWDGWKLCIISIGIVKRIKGWKSITPTKCVAEFPDRPAAERALSRALAKVGVPA